jgi:hypothetical protein
MLISEYGEIKCSWDSATSFIIYIQRMLGKKYVGKLLSFRYELQKQEMNTSGSCMEKKQVNMTLQLHSRRFGTTLNLAE